MTTWVSEWKEVNAPNRSLKLAEQSKLWEKASEAAKLHSAEQRRAAKQSARPDDYGWFCSAWIAEFAMFFYAARESAQCRAAPVVRLATDTMPKKADTFLGEPRAK